MATLTSDFLMKYILINYPTITIDSNPEKPVRKTWFINKNKELQLENGWRHVNLQEGTSADYLFPQLVFFKNKQNPRFRQQNLDRHQDPQSKIHSYWYREMHNFFFETITPDVLKHFCNKHGNTNIDDGNTADVEIVFPYKNKTEILNLLELEEFKCMFYEKRQLVTDNPNVESNIKKSIKFIEFLIKTYFPYDLKIFYIKLGFCKLPDVLV